MLEPTHLSLIGAAVATLVYLWITGCLEIIAQVLDLWIKVLILGAVLVGEVLIGPFLPFWLYCRSLDAVERLITVGDVSMLALWEEIRRC